MPDFYSKFLLNLTFQLSFSIFVFYVSLTLAIHVISRSLAINHIKKDYVIFQCCAEGMLWRGPLFLLELGAEIQSVIFSPPPNDRQIQTSENPLQKNVEWTSDKKWQTFDAQLAFIFVIEIYLEMYFRWKVHIIFKTLKRTLRLWYNQ